MNRRGFLTSVLKATAVGLLAPEWALDAPLKGRSMVSLAGVPETSLAANFVERGPFDIEALEPFLRKIFFEAVRTTPPEYSRWLRPVVNREAALCADERRGSFALPPLGDGAAG